MNSLFIGRLQLSIAFVKLISHRRLLFLQFLIFLSDLCKKQIHQPGMAAVHNKLSVSVSSEGAAMLLS